MSSFISGGGRTYGFDIELVKSPSTSSRTSNSSSPSSAISESINSPQALSTRKPRTPRKRPNQTYNEAAALLSTAYPNIFSSKNLTKPTNVLTSFPDQFLEFLPPSSSFSNLEFLLQQPISHKPTLAIDLKPSPNSTQIPCHKTSPISPTFDNYFQVNSPDQDFDADSILDEEIEEGIDSIMGNLSVHNNCHSDPSCWNPIVEMEKFDFGFGISGGVSALRHTDDNADWWRFPTVDILAISPKLNKVTCERKKKKKKKKKKIERIEELKVSDSSLENTNSNSNPESGIGLKLSFEKVLDAWSDRGSPFSDDILGTESSESDHIARLAQIDLFSENGGLREASVLRYREKRRSRLFSKKIRYQVRKVNADRRPRMKGRFVRRPSSALRDEKK